MAGTSLRAAFAIQLADFELAPEFEIESELAVVFGPSGAGKSLTLRTVAGLVRPDRGQIHLNGQTLYDAEQGIDLPPQARKIGYVPQHYALFPHRSISENIAFGLHDISRSERETRVAEFLDLMWLEELADRKPGEVSGGQQQRTALARALARRPSLLLMDEPFAAVEEDLRAHLREELLRLQAELAIPVLLVTHSRAEAYVLGQRLIILSHGHVIQSGPTDAVFRTPRTPIVARLMGMTNIIQAEIAGQSNGSLVVKWGAADLKISSRSDNHCRGSVVLGIRPEEILFVADDEDQALMKNLVSGVISKDEPQGADHLLKVEVGSELLEVRVSHPMFRRLHLEVGQQRWLSIDPAALHLIPDES